MHAIDPIGVPAPCCTPTHLEPLNMLYIDDDDNVVMKTYDDMIVTACGCR